MKRFRKLSFGGIQSKVFSLILLTIALMAAAFIVISLSQGSIIRRLLKESSEKQQATISEVSESVMNDEIDRDLRRSNRIEAQFADKVFADAQNRVSFLASYATELFDDPEAFNPMPYAAPDPADDGTMTVKVIFAGGVDQNDPAVTSRIGLVANLSEVMISLCKAVGMENIYIGLPEGVLVSASKTSSTWFKDGELREYDPRGRIWYQQAVQARGLIFTDGEYDANTGQYCVECAMPVYAQEGGLQAVIGMDLFLDEILQVISDSATDGEYSLLVSKDGKAVLPMQAEVFPMPREDREADLRKSRNELLSQAVSIAMKGEEVDVTRGQLEDGEYYIIATPITTTGWVLVSAYDYSVVDTTTVLLKSSLLSIGDEALEEYQKQMAREQTKAMLMVAAVLVLTLGGAAFIGTRIVKPLNTITKRISELNEGNLEFKMEDSFRTGDEVQALAESFSSLSCKTKEYMDKVVKVTAERERFEAELTLANQIQTTMMPHLFPAFPDRNEFDIFASMDPAKEVGGDFYDFFLIDDDHLCMVMADVSGKGVPAALFMMSSKIIISSNAAAGKTPARVLNDTNTALCANGQQDMFVTVWIGILEISTGILTAANGGHEYPVLMRDGHFELFKDVHGFLVGGVPGMQYKDYEIRMKPGDKLFVYTDGLPEAQDRDRKMFGLDRMVEALNRNAASKPEILLEKVRKAVDDYVGDAEQFDDLTMLCMEYKGKEK